MNPWPTVLGAVVGALIAGTIALILDTRRRNADAKTRKEQIDREDKIRSDQKAREDAKLKAARIREDRQRWDDTLRTQSADLIALCWTVGSGRLGLDLWAAQETDKRVHLAFKTVEIFRGRGETVSPEVVSELVVALADERAVQHLENTRSQTQQLSEALAVAKAKLDIVAPKALRDSAQILVDEINEYLHLTTFDSVGATTTWAARVKSAIDATIISVNEVIRVGDDAPESELLSSSS